MPDPPLEVLLEPALLHFFPKNVHHPMRNEKLENVTNFADPNLKIGRAAPGRPQWGFWSLEAMKPKVWTEHTQSHRPD